MRITSSPIDNAMIISLDGELNVNTAPDFSRHIQASIRAGQKYLIIDCVLLSYISSAGLRVFYQGLDELEKIGGKILLSRANDSIKQVIRMVNLDSDCPMFTTTEEAIRSLSP
jgi:anti-anti-sigma factor